MRGKIFISYRREDTRADARSIYQRLQKSFGTDQLFMDVDTVPRGSDFREMVHSFLRQCKVVLVVIGRGWLEARDDRGHRRIDIPSDFVRIELAMALARKVAVIPILVDGARMPRQDELPDDLKALVFRQAATVRHETFASDMDVLANDIRRLVGNPWRLRAGLGICASIAALLAVAAVNWPELKSTLSVPKSLPAETGVPTFGVQSTQIATWQKEVQPLTIKLEESPYSGRPIRLADRLRDLSKGQLKIEFEPVSKRSVSERFNALSKGTVDAVWEHPGVWGGSSPAFTLFSGSVPFGLDLRRQARWLSERGLREYDQLLRERLGLNVLALPCYLNPPDGFWFRKPITTVADLNSLTVRIDEFFMYRMAPRFGLKTVDIHGREFMEALHKGAIDGGEYSWPLVDDFLGLGKEGLHYYYPSFHTPTYVLFLNFNRDRWNAFPPATRGLIEETCRANFESDLQQADQRAQTALVRLKTKGVTVHTFPPDILAAAERAMREVTDEWAAKDPLFKQVWASYSAYR